MRQLDLTFDSINDFKNITNKPKIVVIGDIVSDSFVTGETARISPEAPVPILNVKNRKLVPGMAARIALDLAALGSAVKLVGVVGSDVSGANIIGLCNKNKVVPPYVRADYKTEVITKYFTTTGQQLLQVENSDNFLSADVRDTIFAALTDALIENMDAVVVYDCNRGYVYKDLWKIVVASKLPCFLICSPEALLGYKRSNLHERPEFMMLQLNELAFKASGGGVSSRGILKQLDSFNNYCDNDFDELLIIRGKAGMTLICKDAREQLNLNGVKFGLYNPLTSSNTTFSTYVHCKASGMKPERAAFIANIAASMTVEYYNAVSILRSELLSMLNNYAHNIRSSMHPSKS